MHAAPPSGHRFFALKLAFALWFAASAYTLANVSFFPWNETEGLWSSLYDKPPILGPCGDFVVNHTGLNIGGTYKGFFYGNLGGGRSAGAAWNQEIKLFGFYNFAFLSEILNGLTVTGEVRWREGQDPNGFVGANRPFQPSHIEGGKYFRLRPFYLTYITPELFGTKNLLTLSGGWQNPYDFFLQQPLSKFFVNYAIYTVKGVGANIPWTSSYAAWGGYVKVKPTPWYYAQAGLYMAIPETNSTHNHGLYFQGSRMPGKPNNLYAIAETALMPKVGPSQLLGKYAFGGYWWGAQNAASAAALQQGQFGFYWQVEQQLYRPSSATHRPRAPADTSTSTEPTEKGLFFFSMFFYAPDYNNVLPFYFHAGLVYQGLIPFRGDDKLGIVYGFGRYSSRPIETDRLQQTLRPISQSVLEIDYSVVITRWCRFRPFYQFLINPAANNMLKNAHILGFGIYTSF